MSRLAPLSGLRPAPALALPCVLWAALGLAVSTGTLPLLAWWLAGAVLAGVLWFDARRLCRQPTPQVQRELDPVLPLGVELTVRLQLHADQPQWVEVFDRLPGSWTVRDLPQRVALAPGQISTLAYRTCPAQRGSALFDGTDLRLRSPWRLWRQLRRAGSVQPVRVYPDFMPLARLALLGTRQASLLMGAHLQRRRGEGTDFHQMRDYRQGDSLRHIDWKATTRAGRLVSRQYQDERNQQLVLMLDTGQRLLAHDNGRGHFDDALNASLLLAWLALQQGDSVGLAAHGGDNRWVPAQRGQGHLDTLLRASHDLQPDDQPTDFLEAAAQLERRQRRRALVVLVTNLREEDHDDLLAAVHLLQRRHLVCVASLRENVIEQMLTRVAPGDSIAAGEAAAAARHLEQRDALHRALRSHQVDVLDTPPGELAGALVAHYLAIKRAGRL